MAKKGNIRSMRFSDEILEIIESQPGETFTAKFEHLVTRCIMELPRKEQELQQVQDQISQERRRLRNIQDQRTTIQQQFRCMENYMGSYINQMRRATENLENLLDEK